MIFFLSFSLWCLSSSYAQLPRRSLGMYVLLADDTIKNYTSNDNWQPSLFDYQVKGANVLYFTFINPTHMTVPPAYANLAKCRGSGKAGCPTANQKILFSVGGYSYSNSPNPWPFLASQQAAEAMAAQVAKWGTMYGADGIDLDIETGAGDAANVGPNIVHFAQTLKRLNPKFLVTQPVFGYPQVKAENAMVNSGWQKDGTPTGSCDGIGIMVYSGLGSLQWVKDYANATKEWQGFPIHVDVPAGSILAGINGNAANSDIMNMANQIVSRNLGGIMVWMSSVYDASRNMNSFTYSHGQNDASRVKSTTGPTWAQALNKIQG